jgi:hypothetical protein
MNSGNRTAGSRRQRDMIRSRRLLLAAAVVALGLTACGDPSTTAPLASKPPVIKLASGQSGGGSAEAAPAAATVGAPAADSKMAFFGPTEFVYDGDLPALDGPAGSWFFPTGQKPDLDRVAKLAAALGVVGDVRTLPTDQGGGWAVGPEDYSGAVLTIGSDGMLNWWLSAAAPTATAAPAIACGEVLPVEPDAGVGSAASSGSATAVATPGGTAPAAPPVDVVAPETSVASCPLPQPPVGVPTKDEALAKAKQLFADWGYDVASYEFEAPYADQYGASVNASLLLEGFKAPIMLSVGFGENGAVTYASGFLATPQRGADYPTIGAAAGLERLKTQQNQYVALAADGVATKAAPVDAATSGTAIAPEPQLVNCDAASATDCAVPTPQTTTVTLNSVKADLTMLWAQDNTIWLLPAYTFGSADGGVYTVNAVDDAYIEQADPQVATTEVPGQDPGVVTAQTAPPIPATDLPAPSAGGGASPASPADPAATVPAP